MVRGSVSATRTPRFSTTIVKRDRSMCVTSVNNADSLSQLSRLVLSPRSLARSGSRASAVYIQGENDDNDDVRYVLNVL